MLTDEFKLIDNNGVVRSTKSRVEHIHWKFNEIKSEEDIVYPWKVVPTVAGAEFIITAETTMQDWREYAEYCWRLL
ncbi:hypothetical protein [Butyrivibrio proteoclasticus]|nr:hypothetical protein [Butyrivibrio proteoclasticus]